MDEIRKLSHILKNSRRAVFFGGAGMSTESGIPDFRGATGIYNQTYKKNLSPEEIISRDFFYACPDDFFDFYREKMLFPESKPNAAHLALAKLEARGHLYAVVTQNIDGLHQAAGSKNVIELHGSVMRNHCVKCHKDYSMDYVYNTDGVPKCINCGGIIKPDVVLYGEPLDMNEITRAISVIEAADTLIIGGTSLVVQPAAGLINYFTGQNLVLINKSSTPADAKADLVIHDAIGEVLKEATKDL